MRRFLSNFLVLFTGGETDEDIQRSTKEMTFFFIWVLSAIVMLGLVSMIRMPVW